MNYILGKLLDMLYYTVIYFNQNRVREILKIYGDDDEIFFFYNKMRKDKYHIDPPESIYILFFYEPNTPCVMSEYFRRKFKFSTGTEIDFFNLFKDPEPFRRYVIYFYLEPYRKTINIEMAVKGDGEEICKAMVALRRHGERTEKFIDLFYNFDKIINDLIPYLKKLDFKFKMFHKENKKLYQEAVDKFCTDDNINLIKKSYEINSKVNLLEQTFSVSFMNQYYSILHNDNDLDYFLIIGYKAYKSVQSLKNYKILTPALAGTIFTNEDMSEITKALKKEEMTITKLSMKLAMSRSTVERIIGVLYDRLAIRVTATYGKERCYGLNREFFVAVKSVLIKELDDVYLGM